MGLYIKFHPNYQLNEKAKTTDNGSFLKLFKPFTARVLLSLNSYKHVIFIIQNYLNASIKK